MRRIILALVLLCGLLPAHAATIDDVMQRSQQIRLDWMLPAPASDPRVAVIEASFARCRTAGAELRVTIAPVIGETLLGRVVAVNVEIGDWPEGERLFVLAHEVGHIAHGHWSAVGALWREHLPGEVTEDSAASMPAAFGPLASAQSHDHELDADAYALETLHRLGYGFDSALQAFLRFGVQQDGATHPGTRKRMAHLRQVEGERQVGQSKGERQP